MKKVIISAGPMPAKLDSVKIITNKFKGGLVIKTAEALARDSEVEIVKWEGTAVKFRDPQSDGRIKVTSVGDLFGNVCGSPCTIERAFC